MTIKTYAQKSSAIRAAKKSFGEAFNEHCTIAQTDEGGWIIQTEKVVIIEAAPIPAAPVATIPSAPLAPVAEGEVNPNDEDVVTDEMRAMLEQADAQANAAAVNESEGSDPLKPRMSTAEKPTKLVWHIADQMPGAKRKDVIEACVKAGIAYGTARTQYQHWFKTLNDSKAQPIAVIGKDGSISIPKAPV